MTYYDYSADRVKRAGQNQIASLALFCITALVGTFAFLNGWYGLSVVSLMVAATAFWLFQVNSRDITTPSKSY